MTALVEAQGVKKDFIVGGQTINVLKGIDLKINHGDFAVIFGPSGCGKSTLLHSLLGLEAPTTGKILIDGVDVYAMTEDEISIFRKDKIGVVFQQSIWIKSLSVIQNVSFPTRLRGMSRKEAEEIALEKLKIVKMDNWAHHHPSELSSGQQQKISLARALTTDPLMIVADEPTGNLDTVSGDELMDFLAKLNIEQKKTIVMVTHDLEYLRYANKLFHIIDGVKAEEFEGEAAKSIPVSMRTKKGERTGKTLKDVDYLKTDGKKFTEDKK